MSRFSKTFTLSLSQDCTASRMVQQMKDAEDDCRGSMMRLMRKWMQSGFLLEQVGQGLGDSLLNMDREGLFKTMPKKKQAEILIKLLEQKIWQYDLMESVESANNAPASVPDIPTVVPISEPVVKVEAPPKKKRKRPANILS